MRIRRMNSDRVNGAGVEMKTSAETIDSQFEELPAFCHYNADDMTWRFGNQRIVRTICFMDGGFFSTACSDMAFGREYQQEAVSEGRIVLGSAGEPEMGIDLGRDFEPANPPFTFCDEPDCKGEGVKSLQLHARGVGVNAGLRVDICYDLYPGREPWMSKYYRIDGDGEWRKKLQKPLREIRFDCLTVDTTAGLIPVGVCEQKAETRYSNASVCCGNDTGVLATVEGEPLIRLTEAAGELSISCGMSGIDNTDYLLDARNRRTGKAILVFFDQDERQALWHYQRFLIRRWLKADCRTMPPWYKTWLRQWRDTDVWLEQSQETELISTVAPVRDCGFSGLHYVIGIRVGHGARDYEQGFVHGGAMSEGCRKLMPNGFDVTNPASLPAICREAGLEFGMHLFWPAGKDGHCHDFQAVRDSIPALIRFFKTCGASFCWYEDVHAGTGNLLRQAGWMLMAGAVREAIPGFRFARTWIREVEQQNVAELACPFDAHRQGMLNRKTEADIDDYYSVSHEWRSWAARHWFRPSFIDITMAAVDVMIKEGRGTLDDLDFLLASQAFFSCMHLGGMVEALRPEEQTIVRKWVEWNWKHREILQYSQPLEMERGSNAITGMMHLAPVQRGRIGFIGVWNNDPAVNESVSPVVNFQLYGLEVSNAELIVRDIKREKAVDHEWRDGRLVIPALPVQSRGYRMLELSECADERKA